MPTSSPTITRRILVPLDGGDLSLSALPFLRALAGPDSDIVLLRVVPDAAPFINRIPGPHPSPQQVISRATTASEEFLDRARESLQDVTSSRITTMVCSGKPADQILAVSEEIDGDVILMATHAHGPVGKLVLGSVAHRVVESATMPVMLFRPRPVTLPLREDHEVRMNRVIVPFDGSDLAREALPVAIQLAKTLDAPVLLVHAVALADYLDVDATAMESDYVSLVDGATLLSETVAKELEHEADALREHGVAASVNVQIGSAVESITDTMTANDLLVMTSHGEGGIRRWVVGSVARKLLQQSVSPIVLVPNPERVKITGRAPEA